MVQPAFYEHCTITANTAKRLLPLAEEYEMFKLRRSCENVLHAAYECLRKDHRLGQIPCKFCLCVIYFTMHSML